MSKREKILMSVGSLVCALAYFLVPKMADADKVSTLPAYTATVQRVEHLSITIDSTRCLHLGVSTAADGGYLQAADGGLPEDVSYVCSSEGGTACLKEAGRPATCDFTMKIFDKTTTAPFAFTRGSTNTAQKIYGLASVDGTKVDCCPVIGVITRGR